MGLGTQSNLKEAQAFHRRHKTNSFPMLWDATGRSWASLGVAAQPAWVLLNPDGSAIGGSLGSIPYDTVLDVI